MKKSFFKIRWVVFISRNKNRKLKIQVTQRMKKSFFKIIWVVFISRDKNRKLKIQVTQRMKNLFLKSFGLFLSVGIRTVN